jgi:hypothetical protein
MKNFALTLLLTMLTLHLSAAVMHSPADTLQCDTFLLKNGIEVYARIVDISGKFFTVQYCDDARKTHIHSADLEAIRFSDGTQFGKSKIRREMRSERRLSSDGTQFGKSKMRGEMRLERWLSSDGTKLGESKTRRERRFEHRASKVFSPWRLAKTGLLQLLGVWPTSLAAYAYLINFGLGGGGIFSFLLFWSPQILTILLMMYLLFKGISNIIFAIRLKKYQKQESSF